MSRSRESREHWWTVWLFLQIQQTKSQWIKIMRTKPEFGFWQSICTQKRHVLISNWCFRECVRVIYTTFSAGFFIDSIRRRKKKRSRFETSPARESNPRQNDKTRHSDHVSSFPSAHREHQRNLVRSRWLITCDDLFRRWQRDISMAGKKMHIVDVWQMSEPQN